MPTLQKPRNPGSVTDQGICSVNSFLKYADPQIQRRCGSFDDIVCSQRRSVSGIILVGLEKGEHLIDARSMLHGVATSVAQQHQQDRETKVRSGQRGRTEPHIVPPPDQGRSPATEAAQTAMCRSPHPQRWKQRAPAQRQPAGRVRSVEATCRVA